MFASAKEKYLRGIPYKTRSVIELIKGKRIDRAFAILDNTNRGTVYYVKKILKSALSNAQQKDKNIDIKDLYISKMIATDGPRLKRFKPRAMGRATPILHRTMHLYVEVDVGGGVKKR